MMVSVLNDDTGAPGTLSLLSLVKCRRRLIDNGHIVLVKGKNKVSNNFWTNLGESGADLLPYIYVIYICTSLGVRIPSFVWY